MWDTITRFAGDRMKDLQKVGDAIGNEIEYGLKQARDKVIVPAIDAGMEAGVVPAAPGMYGRYLTGTEVPLTKVPKQIKEEEQVKTDAIQSVQSSPEGQALIDRYQAAATNDDNISRDQQQLKDLLNQQQSLGVDIKAHNMGVSPADPVALESYKRLQGRMDELTSKYEPGYLNPFTTPAPTITPKARRSLDALTKPFDENNYTSSGYELDQNFDSFGVPATPTISNTLGQYEVQDGQVVDRYDFNSYTEPGNFVPGTMQGGAGSNLKSGLVQLGGNLADRLGLIQPGSGYDVRLQLR